MLRTLNERVVCGCRRTQERYQQHAVQSFSRTRISVWYPRYAFEHYNYNNLPTRLPAGCSFDCCHGTPLYFIWGEPPKPGKDVPLVVCCGGQPRRALDSQNAFLAQNKKNKRKPPRKQHGGILPKHHRDIQRQHRAKRAEIETLAKEDQKHQKGTTQPMQNSKITI